MSLDTTRRTTAASVLELVRTAVEQRLDTSLPTLDKRALLSRLPEPEDAFEVGRSVRTWADNPVIRAVIRAPTALAVVERWQSLESFGHASHRTRVVDVIAGGLLLDHVCLDGEPIPACEDLFIWGLVAGLLELWSRGTVRVRIDGCVIGRDDLDTRPTTRAEIEASTPAEVAGREVKRPESCSAAVAQTLEMDLLRSWSVAAVAAELGRSSRSLQRALREEGTSFSTVLQRTRLDAALELIAQTNLGLTEIAFCSGFSDHAHLTRTTRKLMDAPPSSLRTLLQAVQQ